MRLSIAQKGLIIVLVPLVFEIGCIGTLFYFVDQAEQRSVRHITISKRTHLGHKIVTNFYEMVNELQYYSMVPTLTRAESLRKKLDSINDDMDRFGTMIKGDPEAVKKFEAIRKRAGEHIDFIEDTVMNNINPTPGDIQKHAKLVYNRKEQLLSSLRSLNKLQDKWIDQSAREFSQAQEARLNLQITMVLFIIGNIVLAFFMLQTFTGGIKNRLLRIVRNIDRYAENEPLLEHLTPGDEIAIVDSAFHEMAEELRMNEQQKQDFISMVSHDLKSPLNSITNVLNMLNRGILGELPDESKDLISTASSESKRLVALINTLLDSALLDTNNFEVELKSTDINSITDKAIQGISLKAESRKIQINCSVKPYRVLADEERIIQVLINLLSNAIKYSNEGSTINVFSEEDSEFVTLSIEDQAETISEDDRQRIFDKFERLDQSTRTKIEGKGLGLAICKAIIEAHEGLIGVKERQNKQDGNIFWITLSRDEV